MKTPKFIAAMLLVVGIAIGIILTFISFRATNQHPVAAQPHHEASPAKKLIADNAGAATAASHAETAPPQKQESLDQYKWATPEDVAKEQQAQAAAAGNAVAPNAVPKEPFKYQSSHTTYYVYGDSPDAAAAGGVPTVVPANPGGTTTIMPTTVSGYPFYAGDGPRAIDFQSNQPPPNWTVGANGLMQNPCVDPPSTRGRAYRGTAQ